jgi:hypothetical protein
MTSVLFYEKPVAINREQHRTAKIGTNLSFSFAAKTNSVPLTVVEFVEASKEYPIVFAAVGERRVPVVLLGLRDNENLCVDAEGKWDARYIPAFVRRYPFVLAEKGDNEFVVCVDEASTAFNADQGQTLFDDAGDNTPFLDGAMNFLNAYQAQYSHTENFIKQMEALDLFTQMSAKTELTDGRTFLFNGLYIIDEKKMLELDDTQSAELLKSGQAGWIYAHLMSLSNLSRLVDRISTLTPPATDVPTAKKKSAARV